MAPHHGIPWSARRLVWSDFQGDPPEGGEEAAKTAYAIYYGWRCRGRAFEFRVVAAFHPRESWVKRAVVSDTAESRRVLAHEQTHFNIAQVYALRLNHHFRGLVEACALSDDALTADAQRFLEEEKATQRRYDDETWHGLRSGPQAAWQTRITQELAR
jgi:Bacterial protein of unknown function (DUF922)